MDDIATAAGISRQTIYAHFRSRDALVDALLDQITERVADAIRAADLDTGPAAEALIRFLDISWQAIGDNPFMTHLATPPASPAQEHDRHQPILAPLATPHRPRPAHRRVRPHPPTDLAAGRDHRTGPHRRGRSPRRTTHPRPGHRPPAPQHPPATHPPTTTGHLKAAHRSGPGPSEPPPSDLTPPPNRPRPAARSSRETGETRQRRPDVVESGDLGSMLRSGTATVGRRAGSLGGVRVEGIALPVSRSSSLVSSGARRCLGSRPSRSSIATSW